MDVTCPHRFAVGGRFELVLNPYKTDIVELPQPFRDNWTTELAKLPIRTESPGKTGNDLIALFSRAAELAASYPGALNYALTKSRNVPVAREIWPLFQSLLWTAVGARCELQRAPCGRRSRPYALAISSRR
jgi:hypothetical protein